MFRMFSVNVEAEEVDETPHDGEEPVLGLSAIAMVTDLNCNKVSSVSLASVFSSDQHAGPRSSHA